MAQHPKPNYPLQTPPQWQLNAFSSPVNGGHNPVVNGNGSNFSSRTGSPAQPLAMHPQPGKMPAMSGVTANMHNMSLNSGQLPPAPTNTVPTNGNNSPMQATPSGAINGNQNFHTKPSMPLGPQQTNIQPTPQNLPQRSPYPPPQVQQPYPAPTNFRPPPMTGPGQGPQPTPGFPQQQPGNVQVPNQQPKAQSAFQPVPLPPIQPSQQPSRPPPPPQQFAPPMQTNYNSGMAAPPPLAKPPGPSQQQPQPPQQNFQPPQMRQMYPNQPQQQQQQPTFPPSMYQQQQQQQQQFGQQRPQVQSPLMQQPGHQQQQQPFNGHSADGRLQYQNQYQSQSVQHGFNKLWGQDTIDLMQNRRVLPLTKIEPPPVRLNHQFHEAVNCNPDIFRCTLNKVPESNNLLQKSRLPLGILIHPFRDLNNLPVITSSTIVRCRVCRTYINPFVYFVDSKKWKCNLCYRVNDLPEEFLFDPVSKTYGDPTRRPEVKSSTIEFIAPSEYTLRPPQPAIFLFLLDVSSIAQQSGYLQIVCDTILDQLEKLPGDTRKQIGFIAYNSAVHFYNIAENFNQPHEVTVLDLDDIFLPYPDNLVVNLKMCKELIKDLLVQLPKRFENHHDPQSSLGAALQAGYKLLSPTGGRITVIQTCLPNHGPGCLQAREDPNNRSSKDIQHLGPATDFYKRLALDCSGQQIAVDLFLLNSQYSDLATLSGISKFSGGCIHHFPLFNANKPNMIKSFKQCFERYLTRKIGFEAVMRVRCTRGLQIHTFHGNFFVRSTDLLSLPNINPDAGFGLQISYEESLIDVKTVCFQAALLYTSSNGERRIRVHTLCVPVTASLSEVILAADVQCIIGLLTKMAVDRSLASNLSDARDAFINATVDILGAYKLAQNLPANPTGLLAPSNLAQFPLYILALMKHTAFRTGTSTRLDDRVYAMCEMKTLPLDQLIKYIYPDFYCIDCLFNQTKMDQGAADDADRPEPSRLQLSAEHLDTRSIFCLDGGAYVLIYIGSNVQPVLLNSLLGVSSINEVPEVCYSLPEIKSPENEALQAFIETINEDKPYAPIIQIIRDSSATRPLLTEKFIDDKNDSSLSYYEFLQHIKTQVK